MASLANISTMRARALVVMATRSQDQDLVASAAQLHDGARGSNAVIPCFGWHPWFSHQLYDDSAPDPTYASGGGGGHDEAKARDSKAAHYRAVLTPDPSPDFIASLPEPSPLSAFIAQTRARLGAHPSALVGEIGIDKAFRLPEPWPSSDEGGDDGRQQTRGRDEGLTPGARRGRRLSPYKVKMAHQVKVLDAQLRLAGDMGRGVSVHGVQAHGILYDTVSATWKGFEREVLSHKHRKRIAPGAEDFSSSSSSSNDDDDDGDDNNDDDKEDKRDRDVLSEFMRNPGMPRKNQTAGGGGGKPFPPRICLHSFGSSPQFLRQYLEPAIPAKLYFSYSAAVNLSGAGGDGKTEELVRATPDDRILVESDLHEAGEPMDAALEDMYRWICRVKGWSQSDGAERIARNFAEFVYGPSSAA